MGFRAFRFLVNKYSWIHSSIGVLGGLLFVVGSVLFMLDMSRAAGILFISGSTGMLIGNVGQIVADYKYRQWQDEALEEWRLERGYQDDAS